MTAKTTSTAWFGGTLLVLLGLAIFTLRLSAPSDLEGYAQTRNIGYVMDLLENGNWLAQHDIEGRILSKPPLHTWLIAFSVQAFGFNRFALTLPSLLATLALTLLVFAMGRRHFGPLAGAMAGLAVILSPMFSKHIAVVRSDAVFTLTIALGAWLAYLAWEHQRGWIAFWIVAAASTLTKGPLGVLLSAAGLLAWFWERRTEPQCPRPGALQWPGLLLFFAICFAWLIPALFFHGEELVGKIFREELLGQAVGSGNDKVPFSNLPQPVLNLLSRFAPFSLFAFYGAWRVFRRPAERAAERRFERFLVCSLLAGLLVFSLAAHFRSDLILPLWPAAALLAGRELAALAVRVGCRRFALGAATTALALFAFAYVAYHPKSGPRARMIRLTADAHAAAEAFKSTGIDPLCVQHLDTPATFQIPLGTSRRWLRGAELDAFRQQHGRRWLATAQAGVDDLAETLRLPPGSVVEVFRWPASPDASAVIRVFQID